MRILHLSTHDISGGAARAAFRLHTALRGLGHASTMLVAHRASDAPTVTALVRSQDFATRLRRRLRRSQILRDFARYHATRPTGPEPFTDDRSQHALDLMRQVPPCDVITLQWVAGFVDYHAFFRALPPGIPVVWQLHDMNVLTGGCHYDQECGQYREGCGACPQLGSTDPEDLSRQVWTRKQAVFEALEATRLHLVAPSRWMLEAAHSSPLLSKFSATRIPNGVDVEEFAPRDRRLAREMLGLPQGAQVVMFVSDNLTNRRKGFSFLSAALSGLPAHNLFLVSVGRGKPPDTGAIPCVHMGHVENNRWLSMIYSAADLFVIPSVQDNLPNTVLESMACGTPVVGFDVGGIPDMVRPGRTGQLVPVGDSVALRHAITDLLNAPHICRQMGAECRTVAREEYSYDVLARRHTTLYESLLPQARLGVEGRFPAASEKDSYEIPTAVSRF
ncbi:MAG TPA: glycosyltransferase family 4 protein [Nitrospiraceae bacterium]|nr:glycosyltransferase family 4 protein [Nitrospiraceae bacterium]